MAPPIVQIISIILPQVWEVGTETETVNDLVTHPSVEFPTENLQEKNVHITATEVVAAGVPGNLWCWIELSPVAFNVTGGTDVYYSAIGGGGGPLDPATGLPYIPPAAPLIEPALGVHLTVHSMMLPWVIHSPWARLVVQTPVAATPLTAYWVLQAVIGAKTP